MKNECNVSISSMKCRIIYLVAIFQARVCSLWEAVGRSVLESCSRILNNLRCLEFVFVCFRIMPLPYTPPHTPQFMIYWAWVLLYFLGAGDISFGELHSPHYGVISNLYIFLKQDRHLLRSYFTAQHQPLPEEMCKCKCSSRKTHIFPKKTMLGSWLFFCVQKNFFVLVKPNMFVDIWIVYKYQRGSFFLL